MCFWGEKGPHFHRFGRSGYWISRGWLPTFPSWSENLFSAETAKACKPCWGILASKWDSHIGPYQQKVEPVHTHTVHKHMHMCVQIWKNIWINRLQEITSNIQHKKIEDSPSLPKDFLPSKLATFFYTYIFSVKNHRICAVKKRRTTTWSHRKPPVPCGPRTSDRSGPNLKGERKPRCKRLRCDMEGPPRKVPFLLGNSFWLVLGVSSWWKLTAMVVFQLRKK